VIVSGYYFHQRRFAGAVIAHEAEDFARLDRKGHVGQRLNGAEILRNVVQLKNRHAGPSPHTAAHNP
jgi:hypothetical protein